MIHIHNFSFSFDNSYKNEPEKIIQNLNLQIQTGETYAILGPNGVGKTTILNKIWQHSFWETHKSKAKMDIQKVFLSQHLPTGLNLDLHSKSLDFYQILFEIYQQESLSKEIIRNPFVVDYDQLLEWFSQVVSLPIPNFVRDFNQLLFDFQISYSSLSTNYEDWSPGTKKKILLSLLLASKPKCVLIDELTNHLDFEAIQTLETKLKSLSAAVLLVDHNSEFLSKNIRNWIYIPLNSDREPIIFKNIDYETVLEILEERKNNQLGTLKNLSNKQKKLEDSLTMQRRRVEVFGVGIKKGVVSNLKNRIEREVTNNSAYDLLDQNQQFNFKKVVKQAKPKKNNLINIEKLEFLIGQKTIQTITEFKLHQGEKIRINSLNGRGKSSLLKLIIQRLEKTELIQNPQYISGLVSINPEIESKDTFIFEQVSKYPSGYSVGSYILEKLKWQEYQLAPFLKKLRLDKFTAIDSLINLSLGEFIRLQFGILSESISNLKLIILDEPGNFLDVFTQQALIKLLKNYHGSLLLVTHDQALVDKLDIDGQFEL